MSTLHVDDAIPFKSKEKRADVEGVLSLNNR
jgi:hypothetical protein